MQSKLHTHSMSESKADLPIRHVIVDRDDRTEAIQLIKDLADHVARSLVPQGGIDLHFEFARRAKQFDF